MVTGSHLPFTFYLRNSHWAVCELIMYQSSRSFSVITHFIHKQGIVSYLIYVHSSYYWQGMDGLSLLALGNVSGLVLGSASGPMLYIKRLM